MHRMFGREIGWFLIRILSMLDTNNLKLMELHFQKLRELSKKGDQMKTAGEIIGSEPETSLDWDPILKERGGFWE